MLGAMTPEFPAPRLSALTLPLSEVPAAADLARDPDVRRLLGSPDPASWIERGQGLVGLGRAATFRVRGGTRFTSARVWWDAVRGGAQVVDQVDRPGTGLLAFGAFAFARSSSVDSGLVVPELVVGTSEDAASSAEEALDTEEVIEALRARGWDEITFDSTEAERS